MIPCESIFFSPPRGRWLLTLSGNFNYLMCCFYFSVVTLNITKNLHELPKLNIYNIITTQSLTPNTNLYHALEKVK